MKKILLVFAMLCSFAGAKAQQAVYNDELYVTVNGETTGPYDATVNVVMNDNGTIRFALDNFMLIMPEGDEAPVGNIVVDNLAITPLSATTLAFNFNDILTIAEGTAEGYDFWLGPELGELPTMLSGKLDAAHLYVVIDIYTEALGTIHVVFGKEENVTAIKDIKSEKKSKFVGAYDLAGRSVSGNFKGIRIIDGKKVVR